MNKPLPVIAHQDTLNFLGWWLFFIDHPAVKVIGCGSRKRPTVVFYSMCCQLINVAVSLSGFGSLASLSHSAV